MRLKLPNGKLSTTDDENSYVMGPCLKQVYNNHRPVDWKVLDYIEQRDEVPFVKDPIEWGKLREQLPN